MILISTDPILFLRLVLSSLLLVSIEKINFTLETAIYKYISKHLEFCEKFSAARRIFVIFLFGDCDETLSLVFDILLQLLIQAKSR